MVDEESKLEEELIVRPTSEAIIWNTYKNWIQSYRDLPIKINQWANVVRWEMRTRLFLRTAEFLWQEGHTAHSTKEEAVQETKLINNLYKSFVEDFMSISVITGTKSESEKFAGAEETYCIEALMQDGKALQAGTSHFLGQNFAKAFDVKFSNDEGNLDYVWASSWGVSTRLMGALIMSHGDDNGLVLPPKLSPYQVIIVPVFKNSNELNLINDYLNNLKNQFKKLGIDYKIDERDNITPGKKFNEYEIKGVPVRLCVGRRDIENKTIELFRRDEMKKSLISIDEASSNIKKLLLEIQENLLKKSKLFLKNNTKIANNYIDFKSMIQSGGFVLAHWDGSEETEQKIKKETKATIRCIDDSFVDEGMCIISGRKSKQLVYFAKAY